MKKQILKSILITILTLFGLSLFANSVRIYVHLIPTADAGILSFTPPQEDVPVGIICNDRPSTEVQRKGNGVNYIEYNGTKVYFASKNNIIYEDKDYPRPCLNPGQIPKQENICIIIPNYKSGDITCNINSKDLMGLDYWAQYPIGAGLDTINADENLVISEKKVIQLAPTKHDKKGSFDYKDIYVYLSKGDEYKPDPGVVGKYYHAAITTDYKLHKNTGISVEL